MRLDGWMVGILPCVYYLPCHPSHPLYNFKLKINSTDLTYGSSFFFLQIDPELEKKLKMNKVSLESEYEVQC